MNGSFQTNQIAEDDSSEDIDSNSLNVATDDEEMEAMKNMGLPTSFVTEKVSKLCQLVRFLYF